MKRFKLWESDFTFTICLGTGAFQINADSTAVEDMIDTLGISLFPVIRHANEWTPAITLIWERAGILAIRPSKFNCLKHFSRNARNQMRTKRSQLRREIGLAPNHVKFWFQNKRNQTKVQNDCADNNPLRSENDRMEEARKLDVQKLRMENSLLKEMHERLSKEITSTAGIRYDYERVKCRSGKE